MTTITNHNINVTDTAAQWQTITVYHGTVKTVDRQYHLDEHGTWWITREEITRHGTVTTGPRLCNRRDIAALRRAIERTNANQ